MACHHCGGARAAVKAAAGSVVSGNMKSAATSLRAAGAHLVEKAKDEAARVREMLRRK
jgi:hypothetical protein